MQLQIQKVTKMANGHLMLDLEGGKRQSVYRGEHEAHAPQVGDFWPPDGHQHHALTGKLEKK